MPFWVAVQSLGYVSHVRLHAPPVHYVPVGVRVSSCERAVLHGPRRDHASGRQRRLSCRIRRMDNTPSPTATGCGADGGLWTPDLRKDEPSLRMAIMVKFWATATGT